MNAITGTQNVKNNPHLFSAWGEFAVFGAYTVVMLAAGAVLFRRRDAWEAAEIIALPSTGGPLTCGFVEQRGRLWA
jgi:hypothetical protein